METELVLAAITSVNLIISVLLKRDLKLHSSSLQSSVCRYNSDFEYTTLCSDKCPYRASGR